MNIYKIKFLKDIAPCGIAKGQTVEADVDVFDPGEEIPAFLYNRYHTQFHEGIDYRAEMA